MELDKSIGVLETQPIKPFDDWVRDTILNECDIVVKDGRIDKYLKYKIAGVPYYNKQELQAQRRLQNAWKKQGGETIVYAKYVEAIQNSNANAQSANNDNLIDFNKGISDVKFRPLYLIGGAILLFIVVILKNSK